jgi:molybdopterin-containing oxidoreductase family iron-sulfur binding subunit
MLKYLNVSPRTTYLARIKNPNMAMPGADKVGWANGQPHHGGHDTHAADPHGAPGGHAKEAQAH